MAYLDAATDRLSRRRSSDFDSMVEGVRAGTIYAHDQKAYAKWSRSRARRNGQSSGLSGQALESAVMRLAQTNPEYIVAGG